MGCGPSKTQLGGAQTPEQKRKSAAKKKETKANGGSAEAEDVKVEVDDTANVNPESAPDGPLTKAEIEARLVGSKSMEIFKLSGSEFTLRYACLSQRGYYPGEPFKANQDAYKVRRRVHRATPRPPPLSTLPTPTLICRAQVITDFNNTPGSILLGVFDRALQGFALANRPQGVPCLFGRGVWAGEGGGGAAAAAARG